MDLIGLIIKILPAGMANMAPPLLSKLFPWLSKPIDFGKSFLDGKRILGDGKTFVGFLFAPVVGMLTAHLLGLDYRAGFLLGFGAMFGDSVGSFLKRRKSLDRGANAGMLDMIDFVLGAIIFSSPLVSWSLSEIAILLIAVPPFHRGFNILGYRMGLKQEPW
ncbi:MAG: CDP-archaeol synthase [Candidatus Altiarchaeota archaeon]|nr:CDP-archaeol synthase [Candidatus Altiarchaeota archaeon]